MTDPIDCCLPEGTLLHGRYLLGAARKSSRAGIAYTAFDRKLRIPTEVYEYFPSDCAVRQSNGSIAAKKGCEILYRDKCNRLRSKGELCLRQPESDVYDVLSANGTLYFIHAVSSERAPEFYACGTEDGSEESDVAPDAEISATETDDARTRTVVGLFEQSDPSDIHMQNETESVQKSLKKQKIAHETRDEDESMAQKNDAISEEEEADVSDHNRPQNFRLLCALLAGGVLLLILCCLLFISSLSRITGNNGKTVSVLGVPLTEAAEVANRDIRVVGRTIDSAYAAGMIVRESISDNGAIDVIVNGEIPSFSVPNFIGMTDSGAQSLFARTRYQNSSGFVVGNIQRTYVDTTEYPDGMIIEQSPDPGVERNAADISVKIARNAAKNDEISVVPALTGKNYNMKQDGFSLLITERVYSDDAPDGTILWQYPLAGEEISGGVIYVVVSMGTEKTYVPDVSFMTLAEAENILYEAGLSFTIRYELHSDIASGLIAEQTPAAGSKVAYGDTIELSVSGEGEWHGGTVFQTPDGSYTLKPGEHCMPEWEGIAGDDTPVFYSSDPHTVAISDTGEVTALHGGHAIVTASYGGSTVSLSFNVSFQEHKTIEAAVACGEKLSLTGLIKTDLTEKNDYTWVVRAGDASISDNILIGNSVGECVVSGESESDVVLLKIHLTEPEKEISYITIPRKSITTEEKTKKLLTSNGLTCAIEKEYSQVQAKGQVTKVRYTGHSDTENYYFAEGSQVTLYISLGQPAVSSIRIAQKPAKLTYGVGDTFSSAGMIVAAAYEDGSEQTVSSGYTVEYDFSTAGRKTVAVSYGGRKASFAVEVVDTTAQSATIKTLPAKMNYAPGDTIDLTGLSVEVVYGNGTKKTFKNGFTAKADLTKAGTATVQITIEGLQAQFTVNVTEKKVRSLDILRLPDKTDYTAGESLNTTGMQLRANYTDGSTATISSGWSATADLTKQGATTVTITYGGKTVSFAVTVRAAEVKATVCKALSVLTPPQKTEYRIGEAFVPDGLVLLAEYTDGSTRKITDGFSASYDFQTAGKQTVLFQYEGQSAQLEVTVLKTTESIRLSDETLTVAVGESVTLGIELLSDRESISYTIDGSAYAEIVQTATGLYVTGVMPGKCTITFTCGTASAVCIVTVVESELKSNVTHSVVVSSQTSISFMPSLVFTNSGKTDTAFSFTANLVFDDNALSCIDAGSQLTGVHVSFDGKNTIVITGSLVIPAGESMEAAYVLFLGVDQTAYSVTFS